VNNYKAFWCAEKIQNTKLKFQIEFGREPSIALMGLAFKPNIDDLRESPAKYIVQKVLQNTNNEAHYVVEPNIEEHKAFKLTNYKLAVQKADIIIFLVAHKEFKRIRFTKEKIVLDFCGVMVK
jgi:UDP-N-acetyl-D-mannosaminuronic acid dehydrogenase